MLALPVIDRAMIFVGHGSPVPEMVAVSTNCLGLNFVKEQLGNSRNGNASKLMHSASKTCILVDLGSASMSGMDTSKRLLSVV